MSEDDRFTIIRENRRRGEKEPPLLLFSWFDLSSGRCPARGSASVPRSKSSGSFQPSAFQQDRPDLTIALIADS
jgi:hypothetical protein